MIVKLELNVQSVISVRSDMSINQYSGKSFHRINYKFIWNFVIKEYRPAIKSWLLLTKITNMYFLSFDAFCSFCYFLNLNVMFIFIWIMNHLHLITWHYHASSTAIKTYFRPFVLIRIRFHDTCHSPQKDVFIFLA